ncbi:MAG: hypothetical protein PVJ27_02740 [Candidatus Brocadiaceae bacterium]|jgi:hypothetical protein
MIGKHRYLGLALGERRVVAAEVEASGGRHRVTRVGEFALAEGASWDEPEEVGSLLGSWLREHGMARDAVVGVPGCWLVTARHDVPPVGRDALPGLLRLAAERVFTLPSEQLLCDYASAPSEGVAGEVLLVGARRDRVEAATEAIRAAGGTVRAVAATATALARAGSPARQAVTVHLTPDGVEVTLTRGGAVRALRHVSIRQDPGSAAARALHLGIRSVLVTHGTGVEQVRVYDGRRMEEDELAEVGARLGLQLDRDPPLPVDGLPEAAAAAGLATGRVAPAAALALAGFDRALIPFDLTEPRLARKPERHWARPLGWAAFLLVVVAAAVAAFVVDRRATGRELATLRAKWEEMEPSIQAAEQVVDTVNKARGWYDRRPPFLDSLVALTLAFPEEGSIWATSLAVQEDMRGVLSGKATSEQAVLDVLDGLKGPGEFSEVKLLYIRETRGAAGDVAFAVTFTCSGAE